MIGGIFDVNKRECRLAIEKDRRHRFINHERVDLPALEHGHHYGGISGLHGDNGYVRVLKTGFLDERKGGHVGRGSQRSHADLVPLEVGHRLYLALQPRTSEQTEYLFRVVFKNDALTKTRGPTDNVGEGAHISEVQLPGSHR